MGNALVTPTMVMTIPKLKLQAELLAVRLKQDICPALTVIIISIFWWTNSTCNGLILEPSTQYLLQNVLPKSQNTLALTNGTTLPEVIARQTPVLVVCQLRFCNQVALLRNQIYYEPSKSRSNQALK